jgi:phosphoribosylglycinamide formyltransferase-1
MYGRNVHEAVIKNKETKSGITIHFVNEKYDEGKIILQAACTITQNDTVESLIEKIQQLEHKHLPLAIENLLQ